MPIPEGSDERSRDAVIFDMDGTLCDTSSIRHLVEGPDRDFVAFHAASASCPPHADVVSAARAEHDAGRAVLVVTSREFIWRDLTLDWLVAHEVPYDALYMRLASDYRKDVVIKQEIAERIQADGFTVLRAWDDKPEIIALWRSAGIDVHEVDAQGRIQ